MKNTINLKEANDLLDKYITTPSTKIHSIESQVIMEYLAEKLGEDKDLRGITGLLHDLDMDSISKTYEGHGDKTVEILKSEGFDIPEIFEPILAHTEVLENSSYSRKTKFDYALSASESITGIIYAYVLMRPEKKIEGTKVKSIKKKLKDKSFAANVNREFINDIEKVGISRDEFIELSINAMNSIADKIGI